MHSSGNSLSEVSLKQDVSKSPQTGPHDMNLNTPSSGSSQPFSLFQQTSTGSSNASNVSNQPTGYFGGNPITTLNPSPSGTKPSSGSSPGFGNPEGSKTSPFGSTGGEPRSVLSFGNPKTQGTGLFGSSKSQGGAFGTGAVQPANSGGFGGSTAQGTRFGVRTEQSGPSSKADNLFFNIKPGTSSIFGSKAQTAAFGGTVTGTSVVPAGASVPVQQTQFSK